MGKLNYGAPLNRQPLSIAGGVGTFNEIWGAAYDQLRLVDNSNAADAALEQAYYERSRAIKAATGIDLGNPVALSAPERTLPPGPQAVVDLFGGPDRDRRVSEYAAKLSELEAQHPELAGVIRAKVPLQADAEALARAADTRLGELMASNPDWTSSLAAFGGGGIASFRDPLVQGTLVLGGGPGAARTVFGRILTVAAKEALLNGGTALAAQPAVQAWREKAGLDHGFDQAATNVLFAAGLGGVLGGAGAGIGEVVGALGRRAAARQAIEEFALSRPEFGADARRALAGDTSAASTMLAEIRDHLPPEVRGAIDAAQADAARAAEREAELAHLSARRADELEARAENAARARELPDLVLDDPARVNRLVRELAPKAESISGELPPGRDFGATIAELRSGMPADDVARRPVTNFLARRLGGVDPERPIAGELKALGLDSRNSPGLFRSGGRQALDNIPADELPAEIRTALGAAADSADGYVSERQWLAALEREQRAPADRSTSSIDDFKRHLEEQGVDVDRLDDDELLRNLVELDDAERRYAAAEPNDLGLSTDEVAIVPPGMTRRTYTAQVVRQVIDRVGAGVGDDVVRMAVDTVLAGEPLEDAIDFALATKVGGRKTLPDSEWRELGSEPPEPLSDAPVDPPVDEGGEAIDWAAFDDDEFGAGVDLEGWKAIIDDAKWLESVVEACKL